MAELVGIEQIENACPGIKRIHEKDGDRVILSGICEHGKIDDSEKLRDIQKEVRQHHLFEYNDKNQKHLWAMWGKADNDQWICIEVGSSLDILGEICEILGMMCSSPGKVYKHGYFYREMPTFSYETYATKNCCKYQRMHKLFDAFAWKEINIDEYVKNFDIGNYDKVNYAEVRFAYDKKPLLWNPAPAMRGNQEKTILCELEEK